MSDKRTTQERRPRKNGATNLQTPRPRRNYARWRAISLSLVYVLFAAHIIHWKITGETLAPLELNEVMYTLELGIVTAGFLFMCALVVGTLFFGRFFCSWACHILVLQDLCAWMLRKLRIKAKPIRSRALLLVPPITAAYMFVWPQIIRAWETRSLPAFHLATDRDGWASFVTNNFWRNLPGPWVIGITFLVCGFLIVYVLGSRTFCTYVCPYGAVFSLADRFSPGRIKVNDACKQCGECTAVCTSGVRVHEEVAQFGKVVNPACMKDLDCVQVCPQNALSYGLSMPATLASFRKNARFGIPYEFTALEEVGLGLVFLLVLATFRGLYGQVPFLLSIAWGIIVAFLSIEAVRLFYSTHVRLSTWQLKTAGRLTSKGVIFLAGFSLLALFIAHSSFIRYHEYKGLRLAQQMRNAPHNGTNLGTLASIHGHLLIADRWGILSNPRTEQNLMSTAIRLEHFDVALQYAKRVLQRAPANTNALLTAGKALLGQGKTSLAERHYQGLIQRWQVTREVTPAVLASVQRALGDLLVGSGRFREAITQLKAAVEGKPDHASIHAALGSALAETGRLDEAIVSLQRAIDLDPELAQAHYNLGTLLAMRRDFGEAIPHYQAAIGKLGDDADLLNNFGFALLQLGEGDAALIHLERATAIAPSHAGAHFNLARVLASKQRPDEARNHLRQAAALDARYAQFLPSE